jgi:hypothetical protein
VGLHLTAADDLAGRPLGQPEMAPVQAEGVEMLIPDEGLDEGLFIFTGRPQGEG